MYPDLPDITLAEHEAAYPDTEDELDKGFDSDTDTEAVEYELTVDLVLEAYGPEIDVALCGIETQPDIGDFCSICQTEITVDDPDTCVITIACSHVFHAECLSGWINGTDNNSNKCLNCKDTITSRQRPRRAVQSEIGILYSLN